MSRLLLIDGEEPVRKIVGLCSCSHGYEVFAAADGQRGIELFQRENPAPTRNLEEQPVNVKKHKFVMNQNPARAQPLLCVFRTGRIVQIP